jgi:hypothetical protein
VGAVQKIVSEAFGFRAGIERKQREKNHGCGKAEIQSDHPKAAGV